MKLTTKQAEKMKSPSMRLRTRLVAGTGLITVAFAIAGIPLSAAWAVPIVPAPFYSFSAKSGCTSDTGCTDSDFKNTPGSASSGGSSARGTSVPLPGLRSEARNALDFSSIANGRIQYSWIVAGTDEDDDSLIPLHISYGLSVSASGQANASGIASAGIDVGQDLTREHREVNAAFCGSNSAVLCVEMNGDPIGTTGTDSGSIVFNATANELATLSIQAIATAVADCAGIGGFLGHGSCSGDNVASVLAIVDPYIYIDPDFLATHPGYRIVVSDGIGNTPPGPAQDLPEPDTIALFGLGLAGLGFIRRIPIRTAKQTL